jgi:type III secretion system low calcium response chaperone LcrH/SycD
MTQALIDRSEADQQLYLALEALESSRRFTNEQLEVIYALGYAHFVQGHYSQALPIFAFLAQYGPTKRHFIYGFALCLQMQGRLQEAINVYSLCGVLFPDCVEATQRIAQCQTLAGDHQAARATLGNLLRYARAKLDDGLTRRIEAMLSVLAGSLQSDSHA